MFGAEYTMFIRSLDHVQLAMPPDEEDRARKFYSGILGIPELPKPAHLQKRGGVWFEAGDLKVHLGVEKDFRPAKKAHPAFLVRDLDRLIELCKREGYSVVDDEPMEGYNRAYIYDPFGNRLEMMEPLG